MYKSFLENYRKMIEDKEEAVKAQNNFLKSKRYIDNNHEHEWFLILENANRYEYYCPICCQTMGTTYKIKDVVLSMEYVKIYKAILEGNIRKANEEIENLSKKNKAFLCNLQAFSDMIEKYGYRLNIDTYEIEEIN